MQLNFFRLTPRDLAYLRRLDEKQRFYYQLYQKKREEAAQQPPSQGTSGADPESQGPADCSLPSYSMAVKMDDESDGVPPGGAGAQADSGQARGWTPRVPQPTGQRPTAPDLTANATFRTGVKTEPNSPTATPSTVVAEPGSCPQLEEAKDRTNDANLSSIAPSRQAGAGRPVTSTPSVGSRPAGHRYPPKEDACRVSKLIC